MKKFIAAFDGLRYAENTAGYAIQLTRLTGATLTGSFPNDLFRRGYNLYTVMKEAGSKFEAKQKQLDAADAATRKKTEKKFEASCRQQGIKYSVQHEKSIALQELLLETVFADLLIIDRSDNFTYTTGGTPSEFIRDLLPNVQCPVLIAPTSEVFTKKAIFLYDGSPSAIYAIRVFSYLLEQVQPFSVEVFSVMPPNKNLHLYDNKLMKEFMQRQFSDVQYKVAKGVPEIVIPRHLKKLKENTIVITGAYRRGMVSRWFRESMADVLMRETGLPIFIAHS